MALVISGDQCAFADVQENIDDLIRATVGTKDRRIRILNPDLSSTLYGSLAFATTVFAATELFPKSCGLLCLILRVLSGFASSTKILTCLPITSAWLIPKRTSNFSLIENHAFHIVLTDRSGLVDCRQLSMLSLICTWLSFVFFFTRALFIHPKPRSTSLIVGLLLFTGEQQTSTINRNDHGTPADWSGRASRGWASGGWVPGLGSRGWASGGWVKRVWDSAFTGMRRRASMSRSSWAGRPRVVR